MIIKPFDTWIGVKKKLEVSPIRASLYFHQREVWWCSIGINIGVEADGKNEFFERPVLILKKFNGHMLWVLPLTSKERNTAHYHPITHAKGISYVCLSQLRTISTKRLLRKISMISRQDFLSVQDKIIDYIKSDPVKGSSEAEATNDTIVVLSSNAVNRNSHSSLKQPKKK